LGSLGESNMFPGGRGMNPRQLQAQMKRMGINMEELQDVEEVIIRLKTKDIIIRKASVTFINAQGQKSYQVTGDVTEVEKKPGIPKEDIMMVAGQAGVTEQEAEKALEECNGEPAEAIVKLIERKG
jgi:nascent polypeptide-associated complex subunit alpha